MNPVLVEYDREKKSIFYFQVAKLGQIVYKTQNNNFQVLAGSASFLLGAYTVGMYKDTAPDKAEGKMNFHSTIITLIVNGYTARGSNSAILIFFPLFMGSEHKRKNLFPLEQIPFF